MLNGASYNRIAVNQAKTNVWSANASASFSASATSQFTGYRTQYDTSNSWVTGSDLVSIGGRLVYGTLSLGTASSTSIEGVRWIVSGSNISATASLSSNPFVYRYLDGSLTGGSTFTPLGYLQANGQSNWDNSSSTDFDGIRRAYGDFSLSSGGVLTAAGARGASLGLDISATGNMISVATLRKMSGVNFSAGSSSEILSFLTKYGVFNLQALGQSTLFGIIVDRSPAPSARRFLGGPISGETFYVLGHSGFVSSS